MILVLSLAGIVLGLLPAVMFLANLPLFKLGDCDPGSDVERVSVLIPARNEERGIEASVAAALASESVQVEVIVLDDHSSDATAQRVESIAALDRRVRCLRGAALPSGWNGKQHACWQLAQAAKYDRIVFLDADVRLRPVALTRLVQRQDNTNVALLSAFPHQLTGTVLERWIIPMMHYILLGFLPFARMRANANPAYAAGCGQLFLTRQGDYQTAGTHAAIRGSRHDGLKLPRAYRAAGLMTDVVDGSDVAECRMYRSSGEVVRGVLKNAIEGIANPRLIVLFSCLLLGGSVLPVLTLVWGIVAADPLVIALSIVAVVVGHFPRARAAREFRQPISGVICHSLATLIFVSLQWLALAQHLLGRQTAWRGRVS